MPLITSTPESWFRTRQSDIYQFKLANDETELPVELRTWLAINLQDQKIEILGPSEHSGWISGGELTPAVNMTDAEARHFQEQWEKPDGTSLDPRWQCYQRRYTDWRAQFEKIEVFKGPPAEGCSYRWLFCEAGLFVLRGYYKNDACERFGLPSEPCIDDWWWACQKFPEIHTATKTPFMMGIDYLDSEGDRNVTFEVYQQQNGDACYSWDADRFKSRSLTQEKVRVALGYPEGVRITMGFF